LVTATREASLLAVQNNEQIIKLAAMPTLANPAHWRCLVESDQAVYRFDVYLTDPRKEAKNLLRYAKPARTEAAIVAQAMNDRRTQIFFEFARFPVDHVIDSDCATQTLVQFADLRYTEPGTTRGSFALDLTVECPTQNK
jgi:hypothetical protein